MNERMNGEGCEILNRFSFHPYLTFLTPSFRLTTSGYQFCLGDCIQVIINESESLLW